jgi:undecaprenyl diphosphate synthase
MSSLKDHINSEFLPKHIAVIMDGNGRWAKNHGKPRVFGHKNGVNAVREITEAAAELGVEHLTLYAFSSENWNRPKLEISALMGLLIETVKKELKTLNKNDIRLNAIGDIEHLPSKTREALLFGIENTKSNQRMTLNLALNYGARQEILHGIQSIVEEIINGKMDISDISEESFSKALFTNNIPDPDLMIRTSGEMRISNFLLWQSAYTELYFTPVLWPDFKKEHLYEAIVEYQKRERRFGKTGEQVSKSIKINQLQLSHS